MYVSFLHNVKVSSISKEKGLDRARRAEDNLSSYKCAAKKKIPFVGGSAGNSN